MQTASRIDPDRLRTFATAVYVAAGLAEPDAQLCADTLVQADLWGINRMA
jgi:LDH2 family malate/lactate/ureidoglycolate dehydrogenase